MSHNFDAGPAFPRAPTKAAPVGVKYVGKADRKYWEGLNMGDMVDGPVPCVWTDGWDVKVKLANGTVTLHKSLFELA